MDGRLVAWARAVKTRRHAAHPVLWLFTDARRLPDPLPAISALPKGLCGVVFRHDALPGRAALARQVADVCRARGLALTVAGDWRLAQALGAGVHLRRGERPPRCRKRGVWVTASAHSCRELRAAKLHTALVFLSPVWPTPSHPGAAGLGVSRWSRLAVHGGGALALGGVNGWTVRRLPRALALGAGAIAAASLAPSSSSLGAPDRKG
jgi:thiamine-phosphate pyrophosphorylase